MMSNKERDTDEGGEMNGILYILMGFLGCFVFVFALEKHKTLSASGLIVALSGWSFFIIEVLT